MPTDIPTAQQLWDQTDNYRREGGPGMPVYLRCGDYWIDDEGTSLTLECAAAILRDHGVMWLVENTEEVHIERTKLSGKYTVDYVVHGDLDGTNKFTSALEAINAAIGAVLDEMEGR